MSRKIIWTGNDVSVATRDDAAAQVQNNKLYIVKGLVLAFRAAEHRAASFHKSKHDVRRIYYSASVFYLPDTSENDRLRDKLPEGTAVAFESFLPLEVY